MANLPLPPLQSPLCTTPAVRDLLEIGRIYEQRNGAAELATHTRQLNQLNAGTDISRIQCYPRGSIFIGFILKLVFESLDQALLNGPESLRGRLDAQERTWQQVAGGESAEFNQMLVRIVDQRLQQREETAQAGLQGLLDQIIENRQAIQVAPNQNQRIEIFQRAMQDLRRAIPTENPEQLALIDRLLEQIAELGLAAVANPQ